MQVSLRHKGLRRYSQAATRSREKGPMRISVSSCCLKSPAIPAWHAYQMLTKIGAPRFSKILVERRRLKPVKRVIGLAISVSCRFPKSLGIRPWDACALLTKIRLADFSGSLLGAGA
jgi:hypothetical protein